MVTLRRKTPLRPKGKGHSGGTPELPKRGYCHANDMTAFNHPNSLGKVSVSCQPCKPLSCCHQVLCRLWEVDGECWMATNSSVRWWTVGQGISKTLATTLYDDLWPSQKRKGRVSRVAPHLCLQQHCQDVDVQPQIFSCVLLCPGHF